ncbi:hypothetical protein [Actinomadura violacea]|uniref:Uncharacterized protein n=1 Tax=Actinomadura violacea TaxID=2819934 RepID=A0ABS3RZ51_9ACTN|nr:hypothetical protein [Actinomadura violacea]MBO2461573.1 hypothetical protein [Actinomadura violacea]
MATEMIDKKPTTLYREGNRSAPVIRGKSESLRAYRRQIADAEFGPDARAHVLQQVSSGVPLAEAAAQVNVSIVRVYGRALWDEEFRVQLDDALDAYSAPFMSDKCGTPAGYRRRKCRCRNCRAAHSEETARYR